MFGDPILNQMRWPIVKSEHLFADRPRLGTTRPATGEGYLVVRVGEIGRESVTFENCGRVPQNVDELRRFALCHGDILLARAIGSKSQLGKCSFFAGHPETVVADSHVMRLRLNANVCDPYWFYFLLASDSGRQLLQSKGGATAVQFNINAEQASGLDVPLPPIKLQQQFCEIARRSKKARARQCVASIEAEALFSALQQQAFSGQL
jgi:type I restriction enzyme S subunit